MSNVKLNTLAPVARPESQTTDEKVEKSPDMQQAVISERVSDSLLKIDPISRLIAEGIMRDETSSPYFSLVDAEVGSEFDSRIEADAIRALMGYGPRAPYRIIN